MAYPFATFSVQNLSIRSKLIVFLMATSLAAIVLVSILFSILINKQLQNSYYKDLQNLLTILSHNTEAALIFDVPEDAKNILTSLHLRESIVAAYIFDEDHKLFAQYENPTVSQLTASKEKNTSLSENGYYQAETQIRLENGTTLGKIVLYDDLQDITNNKRSALLLMALAGLVAFLASIFLAHYLRDLISRPLNALTEMVQQFTVEGLSEKNSPLPPALAQTPDEIGLLTSSFLSMRQQLQNSYKQLEHYNVALEGMVQERTLKLQKTLQELKESQSQLVHSEKMAALGHLVAGVAHEVNNNINFISNSLPLVDQLLQKFLQLPPPTAAFDDPGSRSGVIKNQQEDIPTRIHKMLANAAEGVRRTQKILSDLGSFAQPNKGLAVYTDIHHEIDSILNLLKYDMQGHIEIIKEFAPSLPLVPCLRDQMNQVYMNLLLNAIQAIDGTGTIRIKTWHDAGLVSISIRDSGEGIHDTIAHAIFDPFFTTKKVGKGTGLGLSISYGIVQHHNGTIRINAQGIGAPGEKGAEFIVTLPLTNNLTNPPHS